MLLILNQTAVTREFDDSGIIFSGGELQKICIARIYAKKSSILILDEPSSSLDPFSENDVINTMFELAYDKTVIIISHRLSNIKNVDKIFFLENGSILEFGSHEELMELNGKYAEMFNMQKSRYEFDNNKNDELSDKVLTCK